MDRLSAQFQELDALLPTAEAVLQRRTQTLDLITKYDTDGRALASLFTKITGADPAKGGKDMDLHNPVKPGIPKSEITELWKRLRALQSLQKELLSVPPSLCSLPLFIVSSASLSSAVCPLPRPRNR